MRRGLLFLFFLLGCTADALEPQANCAAEMAAVRAEEGNPSRTTRRELGGSYSEEWIYTYSGITAARTYEFKWGNGYNQCSVTHPGTGKPSEPICLYSDMKGNIVEGPC